MREVFVRESDRSIVTISSKDFFVQNTVQYVGMAAVVRYSYVQQYCKDLKTTIRSAYVVRSHDNVRRTSTAAEVLDSVAGSFY